MQTRRTPQIQRLQSLLSPFCDGRIGFYFGFQVANDTYHIIECEDSVDGGLDFGGYGKGVALRGSRFEFDEDFVDGGEVVGVYFCDAGFEGFKTFTWDIMSCNARPSIESTNSY